MVTPKMKQSGDTISGLIAYLSSGSFMLKFFFIFFYNLSAENYKKLPELTFKDPSDLVFWEI